MYTVEIGRQFLDLYNKKTKKNYAALDFFEEEFFPVLFDSEDKKQLFPFIHNSAFTQPSYPRLAEKEEMEVSQFRKKKFYEDLELIPKGQKSLSHSALIGAKSGSVSDVPSGQVSNIELDINKEDIIFSWIGGALGIGVKGGYDLIIQDENLWWYLFKGWSFYRKFLQQSSNVKGRQLPEWNCCWINYGVKFKDDLDRAFKEVVSGIGEDNKRSKNIKIRRNDWTKLIFNISRFFEKEQTVIAYAYRFGFGQSFNRTLGFFHIKFEKIDKWYEIFDRHLNSESKISREGWTALTEVYRSEFGFVNACLQGGIGIRSLQPKNIYKYTTGKPKNSSKLPKRSNEKKKIQFLIYKTWLIAMLNKKEILSISDKLAGKLYEYSTNNNRGKTTKSRDVDRLWEANNLNQFVEALTEISQESKETRVFKEVVNTVVLDLPEDRFKLFLTLTKFNYKTY